MQFYHLYNIISCSYFSIIPFLFIVQTFTFSISVIVTILQGLTIYTSYIYYIFTQRKELQRKRDIYISLQRKCIRKDLLTNIFTKVKVMFMPKNICVFLCTLKYYSYLCSVESNQITRGCMIQKFFPYCMYKLSLFCKSTKKLLIWIK